MNRKVLLTLLNLCNMERTYSKFKDVQKPMLIFFVNQDYNIVECDLIYRTIRIKCVNDSRSSLSVLIRILSK